VVQPYSALTTLSSTGGVGALGDASGDPSSEAGGARGNGGAEGAGEPEDAGINPAEMCGTDTN